MDYDEKELAAELAVKTIYFFNNKCTEFLNPFDGSGNGVLKYAWSASQYLELIIEAIFGISSTSEDKEVIIAPNLCKWLKENSIFLTNLMVFDGIYLDVYISNGKIDYKISDENIKIRIR